MAKTAAEAAAKPITFDDDDDSIILFANTSDDDKDGTGVASTSVTNLKDFVREDGDNYVTNAIYWVEKNTDQSIKTIVMVIDTDSELDADVFGLTK